MNQPEMLPIVEVCEANAAYQRAVENEKARLWGARQGTLTIEQIQQSNHPNWSWGDYEI
jgi:hypothetical protein